MSGGLEVHVRDTVPPCRCWSCIAHSKCLTAYTVCKPRGKRTERQLHASSGRAAGRHSFATRAPQCPKFTQAVSYHCPQHTAASRPNISKDPSREKPGLTAHHIVSSAAVQHGGAAADERRQPAFPPGRGRCCAQALRPGQPEQGGPRLLVPDIQLPGHRGVLL